MRLIYLLRHASSAVRPDEPARDWPLSERGVQEAQALAGTAVDWGIESLYSSSEAKARSTALILGDALDLPVNVSDAFDELRMEWIGNADRFNEMVRAILEGDPAGRGFEAADDAADRFARGIEIVAQGAFPAAIVSHGRILSAYLSRHRPVEDPFALWRSIPFPGWTVIDLEAPNTPLQPFA